MEGGMVTAVDLSWLFDDSGCCLITNTRRSNEIDPRGRMKRSGTFSNKSSSRAHRTDPPTRDGEGGLR
ncbi:hypothetical protein BDZ94DRAFT_1267090, partial [Collybia nuda]